MPESFEVETVLPVEPERVYNAWLDTREHAAFTGSPALVEAWVGGRFTAHDGYSHGITLQLEAGKRIVQAWRSSEFPTGTPDSKVYVDLEAVKGGTRLRILHRDVPSGHAKRYRTGWLTKYFKPMAKYFVPKVAKPSAAKPAAAKAAKPAVAKPAAAKAAKPAVAKPVAAKPVAAKPVAAKPVAAKPVAAKPVAVKPVAVKPAAAKPASTKPARSSAKQPVRAAAKRRASAKKAVRAPARKPAKKAGRARAQ
jgi:uncharacterized protein YndB with AHSA1/START domain